MADELTYVLITPYTIFKSRTGNVVARLLSETGLDLVGARMFAPSRAMAKALASCFPPDRAGKKDARRLLRDYILDHFVLRSGQKRYPRVLLLLLRGPNAVAKISRVAGEIRPNDLCGGTLRGSYGNYLRDPHGNVLFFEPAVLIPKTKREAARHLKIFARYADSDGGICRNLVAYPRDSKIERTLVMIKPENFTRPSRRPGSILDLLARSGLTLLACKVHHMSLEETEKFYGPNRPILRRIYTKKVAAETRAHLQMFLDFQISGDQAAAIGRMLGPSAGDDQFEKIISFMSGVPAAGASPAQRKKPGPAKLLLLVYEGKDAVARVRTLLGPTNPANAEHGTIRAEFGQSIMVNAAHASDSVKNARREIAIVRPGENNIRSIIGQYYGKAE